jgi:DNA-binding MarR family transcriptional regulator
MASPPTDTARAVLEVTTLLMRSFAARMRQRVDRSQFGNSRLEPSQIGILARTSERDCSLSELAQHQSVRLPTMSRSVALLVERGWLERWIPESNRRQTMVRLTPEGRRVFAWMKRDAEKHVARMLAGLTPRQRTKANAGLKVLIAALQHNAAANAGGTEQP